MELHHTTKARSATIRKIGWLAVASMLATALLAPASPVAAIGLTNQAGQLPISWDAEGFDSEACAGVELEPGQVLWHFIHNQTEASSGNLTATFDGATGEVTVANGEPFSSNSLHYWVYSGQESLTAVSDDVSDGKLVLSHICTGAPEESQPEESQPEESQPEESQPEESQPEESQPEESQPEESQPEESQPEESVEAETDTPSASDPETDTLTGTAAPSDSWRMVLIALAALMASVLVMTPAKVADRRR